MFKCVQMSKTHIYLYTTVIYSLIKMSAFDFKFLIMEMYKNTKRIFQTTITFCT